MNRKTHPSVKHAQEQITRIARTYQSAALDVIIKPDLGNHVSIHVKYPALTDTKNDPFENEFFSFKASMPRVLNALIFSKPDQTWQPVETGSYKKAGKIVAHITPQGIIRNPNEDELGTPFSKAAEELPKSRIFLVSPRYELSRLTENLKRFDSDIETIANMLKTDAEKRQALKKTDSTENKSVFLRLRFWQTPEK